MALMIYDEALRRLLLHEGGYTNHPSDPGGPTNFGITLADYRRYVMTSATAADVRAMNVAEAKAIYKAKYWDALRCGELEPGVDYSMFDYGVNSGVGRAGRVLRRLLDLPDTTSIVTEEVIAAANARGAAGLVVALNEERLHFLQGLKTWPVFGAGWGRRVAEVKLYAVSIAQDIPVIGSPDIQPAPGRGMDPDHVAQVRALQKQLFVSGYDPGAIDGDLGPKTIKAFQRSRGLTPDGIVGDKTLPQLDAALHAIAAHAIV
jgi:lysozyme family protein